MTKSHLILGLCTLLASTSMTLGAPALRSEVRVIAPIVTVGDMFDSAGAFAEAPLFRAPAPGTSGLVSVEAVRRAAALVGITEFDADGVLRVRVARDATPVGTPILSDLITDDLRARGMISEGVTALTTYDQRELVFNAEAVADPVRLVSLRYLPATGTFAARFILAGRDAPLELSGRIELMVEAPHLVASKRAGDVLRPEDIEMRQVPLRFAESAGFAERDQVEGMALMRQSRAGMVLRAADVTEPAMVTRNDAVTIYYRRGPLTLTVKGQALGSASRGQSVQVLNLMSKKVVNATAVSDGAVEVSTPALNVAAL